MRPQPAQLGQSGGLHLTGPLAGEAERPPYLGQAPLLPVPHPEAQGDDVPLPGVEGGQGLLHGAAALVVLRRGLRGGEHRIGHHVHQGRALAVVVVPAATLVERGRDAGGADQLVDLRHRHLQILGQLHRGGLPAQGLLQAHAGLGQLRQLLADVHREADGAPVVGDGAGDGLPDPPVGVGGEAEAPLGVELLHGLEEADVALLDQVPQVHGVARPAAWAR